MQRSITIERYKGIKKLNVPTLAPFTLIGGRNDVGKSSFLEAVYLFYDRQNPAALMSHLGWRNVGAFDATPENLWDPAFYNLDSSAPIVITAVDQNKVEQDVRYRVVRDYVAQQNFQPFTLSPTEKPTLQTQAPSQVAVGVIAKQGTQTLQDTYVTVSVGGITSTGKINRGENRQAIFLSSGRVVDPAAPARLTQLISHGRADQIVNTARLVDDRLEGLAVGAVTTGVPYIMAKVTGLPRQVPLSFLGAGIGIVVHTALAVSAVPNGTVLIDELETGVHHAALPAVIQALSKVAYANKTQIIATTHSYECIKAAFEVFKNQNEERFTYLRLERNKEGDLTAKVYPGDALAFALDSEWEVR